jgi:nicotinamidase-related amidase
LSSGPLSAGRRWANNAVIAPRHGKLLKPDRRAARAFHAHFFTDRSLTMTTPRRALIVIDVQNEYVTGDLPIEFPDVQTSLANIGRAMDAARAAGIPVVVVQNFAPATSPLFARGSTAAELHTAVSSRRHDHYVEKSLPSAFTGTDLADWLAAQRVDTLTVAGYMTHNCDASTINHAVHAGLAVEFLHDATGSVPYENSAGFCQCGGNPPGLQRGAAIALRGGGEYGRVDSVGAGWGAARARQYLYVESGGTGPAGCCVERVRGAESPDRVRRREAKTASHACGQPRKAAVLNPAAQNCHA